MKNRLFRDSLLTGITFLIFLNPSQGGEREAATLEAQGILAAQSFLECGRRFHASSSSSSPHGDLSARMESLTRCTRPLYAPKMSERNRSRLTATLALIQGAGTPSPCSRFQDAAERFAGLPPLTPAGGSIDLCFRFQLSDAGEKIGLITLIPGTPQPKLARLVY